MAKTDNTKTLNLAECFEDYSCGAIEETKNKITSYIENSHNLKIENELASACKVLQIKLPSNYSLTKDINANTGVFSSYYLYEVFYKNGDYKSAAAYIKKAVEFLKDNIFLREKAAEVHFKTASYRFALQCYNSLIKFSPSSVKYQREYFKCLYMEKRYKDIISEFNRTKNKSAAVLKNSEVLFFVGLSYLNLRKFSEAVKILETVRGDKNLLPGFEETKAKMPAPEKIINEIKQGNKKEDHSKLLYQLGMSYLFSGKYNSALQIFESIKKNKGKQYKEKNINKVIPRFYTGTGS